MCPKAIIIRTPAVRPRRRLTGCSLPCPASKKELLRRSPNWYREISTIPCCWNRTRTGKFTRFPKTSKCAATTSLYPCSGPKLVPLTTQHIPYPFRTERSDPQPGPTFKLDARHDRLRFGRDAGPVLPGWIERPIIGGDSFQIDEFGRLWFADTGKVNQFESDVRTVCPPKLLIYDLKNNKKISELRPLRCRRAQTRRVFVCNGVTVRLYIVPQDRTRFRRRGSNKTRCWLTSWWTRETAVAVTRSPT